MSTFLDVATDSLTSIGQAGIGQSISIEMSAQALRVANRMLAKWSTRRLYLPTAVTAPFQLTQGKQDYTVGQTGATDFAQPRLLFVEAGLAVIPGSTTELPLNILDKPEWGAIRDKGAVCSLGGVPSDLWPEYTYPNMAFHVWPIPSVGLNAQAPVLKLAVWQILQQFASLFDVLTLPPGYEEALQHNLAFELCSFYDVPPVTVQQVGQLAADSLVAIQTLNAQSLGGVVGESRTLASPNLDKPLQAGPAQGAPPQSTT